MATPKPRVAFVLGSKSDVPVAEKGTQILDELGVPWSMNVASAHRTPERVVALVRDSPAQVLIGVAGVAAALPGVLAALTERPVIGVPVSGKVPFDSLLSIVQMPPGIPVGCVGVDRADNAALLAAAILALQDKDIAKALKDYRKKQHDQVVAADEELQGSRATA